MYYLKRDKYSNLTTDQLKLLSNKVLYRFQDQCQMQAAQWETKIAEIIEVASSKGWDVTREINA
jgi:predicted RNA-binding protein